MATRGAPAGAQQQQAPAATNFTAQGVYTETSQKAWNNKVLYNWKINGEWYGVGDREPDGIYEGDTISFEFKNGKMKDDGSFYKNLIGKSVQVVAAGAAPAQAAPVGNTAAPAQAAYTPASGGADDRQKNIVMQSSMRTAAQLLGAAITSGNLTLPANAKSGAKKTAGYDAMVLAFGKLTDDIYLKAMNIDGYVTQDEAIIDSMDDDDMGDFDDDLPN